MPGPEVQLTGLVLFLVVYVLITARRLSWLGFDRPAAALAGAVATVALGVLSPQRALDAVDAGTLMLLFGVMGMGAFLAVDGFFDQAEAWLVRRAGSPARLLGALVWGSGLLSALVTNDAVCVLGAPLVVRLVRRHELPALPFLLALATGANTGSVATLVGNPQNMLCASLGELSYRQHLLMVGPLALLALGVNHALLAAMSRRTLAGHALRDPELPLAPQRRSLRSFAVIGATAVACTLGADLAWTAVGGFVLLMFAHRRDTRQLWAHIDWSLLVFFAGLFIVVEGFVDSGGPAWFFARFPLPAGQDLPTRLHQALLFLLGSNLVSNVPFILVVQQQVQALPDPRLSWELLAVASTFAGNLTLVGSAANIIVAEQARDIGGIGFWEHLRVGLPLALITTAMGAVWLGWVGG